MTDDIRSISLVSEVEGMSRIAPYSRPVAHARWWSTYSVRRVSLPVCRMQVASYAVGNDIGRQRPRAVELAAWLTTLEHSCAFQRGQAPAGLWERAPRQWALENAARLFFSETTTWMQLDHARLTWHSTACARCFALFPSVFSTPRTAFRWSVPV